MSDQSIRRIVFALMLTGLLAVTGEVVLGAPNPAGDGLEGFVRNETGNPLAGAIISLFKENWNDKALLTTKSQRDASFLLSSLRPGKYVLNIVKMGYEPTTYSLVAPLQNSPLFIILKAISQEEASAKNWDFDTVLRASTDKNPIFRVTGATPAPGGRKALKPGDQKPATRGGQIQVSAISPLSPMNYSVFPSSLGSGFSTRFAYVEPLSVNSNFIVTGLITTGVDSEHRIRSIINYKASNKHKLQLTAGYDKMGAKKQAVHQLGQVDAAALENDILDTIEPIQNINLGIQDYFQIFEPLKIVYGFDINYNNVGRGTTRISPKFQLYLDPVESVQFRFLLNTDRVTRATTMILPEGEVVTLSSPYQVAKGNDKAFGSSVNHLESGVSFLFGENTNLEISSFLDEVAGSGFPFVAILKNPQSETVQYPFIPSEMSNSRGFRLNLTRKWSRFLTTSVLYVYGSAAEYQAPELAMATPDGKAAALDNRFFNVVSAGVNASIPKTGTDLAAVYRYSDGNPLTPVDAYSNHYDVADNSLNVFVRQTIPLFKGTLGRWEAILDIRNILDQGIQIYETVSGDLILVRSTRSIRGGINFRF